MIKNSITTEIYEDIPCWNNGVWETVSFPTREAFADTLYNEYFKEPGLYNFNETSKLFYAQATYFTTQGVYCIYRTGTSDFKKYWDFEKKKSRKGVFFIDGDLKWYLPRDYYFWLNFLPIYDKVKKRVDFASLMDAQYHMSLYEWIAELKYKHGVVTKKRQFGSSFYHVAKLINTLWFEQSATVKMGASLDTYVNSAGSWKYADMYINFLNESTAWYRNFEGGVGLIKQQIETTINGKKIKKGLGSVLQKLSFEQSDTNGVGGGISYFFYEEAGVAKSMDKTYEFLRPAMEDGQITTGFFIAAGSVGDLKQCEPLKAFMYKPDENGFFGVPNKYADDRNISIVTGLFVPEQWSMKPYIDEYGNSLVEDAIKAIIEQRKDWEKNLRPEIYQLRISQKPLNLAEAFAYREESIFPKQLIEAHSRVIDSKEYPYTCYELTENRDGQIIAKRSNKLPISQFPVDKKAENKIGVLQVWEEPDAGTYEDKPDWGTYYASIDPVAVGKTSTSESLCSIYVYKNPIEVTRYVSGQPERFIEGDKIVAAWCGRYDDLNETHKMLEMIIEWYNAWTLVENNISLFIQYMISVRKHKYLVPKSQIVFLKEAKLNANVYQEYGWKNVSSIFKDTMLPYLITWLTEVIDEEYDENGTPINKVYGITRLPDKMACTEMLAYIPGLNVDRLISLAALIAFAKMQNSNLGNKKRVENEDGEYLDNSPEIYKLKSSPFKNIGRTRMSVESSYQKNRNPFKRLK